jgi:hypothetical protein
MHEVFDSETALELNPEVVTLTLGTLCISYPEGAINRFHPQNLTYRITDKFVNYHTMKA